MATSYHLPKKRGALKGTRISCLRDIFFRGLSHYGRHFKPPHLKTDKPTNMEIDEEATDYMDIDPGVLMLSTKRAH